MTNETLSQYANLGVYSAMSVFTIAMIAFAIDLAGTAPKASSARPRKAAGAAMMLTRLGGLLLIAAAAMRGLSVHRPPLGNMFEFALVGAMFVIVVFVAISLRRDVRWLGLFVIGPVLLTLGLAIHGLLHRRQ